MPRLVETFWFYKYVDEEYSEGESESKKYVDGFWRMRKWSLKSDSLNVALEELSIYCNDNNLEIKSIIPLTRAQSYEFAQAQTWVSPLTPSAWGYGMGHGWGVTMVNGFAALLQRVEDLTEEEYAKRINRKKRIIEIKENIAVTEKELAVLDGRLSEINKNILLCGNSAAAEMQMKKGIFGVKFLVAESEFKTEDEARKFMEKSAKDHISYQAEADGIQKQIEVLAGKIQALQNELNKNDE